MEIIVRKEQTAAVVVLKGRLDAVTAPELERSCLVWIEKGEHKLLLDLAALEYVSSAGLRSVLSVAKKLKAAGGSLGLCSLSGLVQEVFSISGFDSFLPVYASVTEGLEKS